MPKVKELIKEVLTGFEEKLMNAVKKNLDRCIELLKIKIISILDIIILNNITLDEIRDKFGKRRLFLKYLIIADEEAKKVISEQLEPLLRKVETKIKNIGKVVIGTVQGDIHDIGKNIVAAMLFAAGFEVIDSNIIAISELW
ncbi:MAG: hypothetical protein QXL69_03235 [Candidatus Bathyarchaeia archaeon]|nr:hypothetical protein [Candidatus Bathyarchaeota archaeon]